MENENWWIATIIPAIASIAALITAIFAYRAGTQTKKGVWAQVTMQLMGEYSSPEMVEGINRLRIFKDSWEDESDPHFEMHFTLTEKQNRAYYNTLNNDRRRYSHYFHKMRTLLDTEIINEGLLTKIISPDQVEFLLHVVEPLEKEVNPNYDPSTFLTFSRIYNIQRSHLVNRSQGKEQQMNSVNSTSQPKEQTLGKGNFELKFVLDRFNFFLVATAFLIAAFITLVIYNKQYEENNLPLLAYAVNAVGLYLAIYFAVANYHGALCLSHSLNDSKPSSKEVEGRNQPHTLLLSLIKSLLCFPIKPLSMSIPAVHTWLIPFLFCLFWLTTWFGVLPFKPISSGIALGVPLTYLFLLGIISSIKSWLESKRHNKPPNLARK